MNENNKSGVHWSFWVIGIITLVWNIMGSINFVVQMNPEMYTTYRETERLIIEGRPIWATAGFAAAVFGGAIGSLLLLFKKSVAYHLFIVALLGVIVTMAHALSVGINFGLGEVLGIIVMPIAVAIFLIWYSKLAKSKDWLN